MIQDFISLPAGSTWYIFHGSLPILRIGYTSAKFLLP